ncbi:MAG: type II toxin-antitoxin system VapC family toxin [Propionibacteriaceae bacterium]|jgi:predicted nucleic acid-binding protein|nr:type II toxin-antitoxin system VapC family toxin [Propionibacteriaceae bacterium]
MIVIDAGAWTLALLDAGSAGAAAAEAMAADARWIAPAHAPLEVFRTIRRYRLRELIDASFEVEACQAVVDAAVEYLGADKWLLEDVLGLRHNLSIYDAPYLAIALRFDAPLLTADRKLARAAQAVGATTIDVAR